MKQTIDKIISVQQMLVSRASRISASIDEIAYTQQQIGLITSKIDSILASLDSSSASEQQLSDIVSLLNLPRAISEYTQQNIGQIIQIPYNDQSGIITSLIDFQVVGVNHHKDINDQSKPTITLMSKNILRLAAFDCKESSNPDSDRQQYGNNRWSVSNIRQWLNSDGAANSWFIPQHEYDTSYTDEEDAAYSDEAGFLAGFSSDIKQHLATVKNKTVLCESDREQLSKVFEETEDKVFLPSYTEMGFGILDGNNPEGAWLSNKFTDDNSRIKSGCNDSYMMRSPFLGRSYTMYQVFYDGYDCAINYSFACYGNGVAPLLVLC